MLFGELSRLSTATALAARLEGLIDVDDDSCPLVWVLDPLSVAMVTRGPFVWRDTNGRVVAVKFGEIAV